ncbi:TLP18.3/Psb32/MOLO-1 phosphatase superfamily protein [Winogradskyella wandonensis]|uniref:TLP18.3/Psb32/MOLO-1 phosphatase superfamily protein n=1 Tax=Winogradskyella wandonensis TaxID=1442586 RepID=A0A4R1KR11_9FLAO|nr:TPM domain-containing protein [Winogradskyella wandonensis]TCK66903.1 TLP18.3/Psb32/MOLO-1 phosphatase superfamily protein [Winogradskyella wandonensis]
MSNLENFLTASEEEAVINAIREAEKNTSGEIRVHIEQNCDTNVYEHAMEVFHYLKMDNTKAQNGVLIYVAVDKKAFVIYGDKGINDVVGKDFWNTTRDTIANHFKSGKFAQGLIEGIQMAGKELSDHFPWYHGNTNELDNSISKG